MAWAGKILRVNLTAGTCKSEPLNMQWARDYIGQRGLATKYYVVQNSKSLKCSVVPKKPKGKTVVLVGGGTPYKTRSDARATLRTVASCR